MSRFDLSIAGEINLDLIMYGLPKEMPVERELIADSFIATLGSSSAIVAHNAAAIGARVSFSTLVSQDHFAGMALERLQQIGVDLSGVRQIGDIQTGVTIVIPHGETRHMLTHPGTMERICVDDLDIKLLCEARHFHLSSLYLQKGLHEKLPKMLKELKREGLTISLDTNDDPDDKWGYPLQEILPYVDCFLPNESEVCRMTRCTGLEDALDALPAAIPLLAVKRGARGVRVREGRKRFDVDPLPVVPVDTIGAGDSFDAGFLFAYLSGREAEACARAGNITGALSTQGKGGTESFRNETLRQQFLQEHGFYEIEKS